MASSQPPQEPRGDEPGLVGAAQAGNREAFTTLVERYWDRLYRWLYHLTHDRHAAEDLAQDAFLKAFAHVRTFRPGSHFAAWLFRIAHNAHANSCRGRPARDPLPEEVPAPGGGPDEQAASREALQDVARAVEELPAEFRAALLLRVEQDLPFARIAEVLGVTEETARWRVFKARRLLLKRLSPPLEQGTP